jgi:hypothetical protein
VGGLTVAVSGWAGTRKQREGEEEHGEGGEGRNIEIGEGKNMGNRVGDDH